MPVANKRFGEAVETTCAFVPRSPLQSVQRLDGCRRCGGFLVDDHMDLDIEEHRTGGHCWAMRCVQCGDMIDETILRNRYSCHNLHHADLRSKEVSRVSQTSEDTGAA